MAALSVRELYEEYIKPLSASEREELRGLLEEHSDEKVESSDITELAGLGASLWEEVDADEYVESLRGEWEKRR